MLVNVRMESDDLLELLMNELKGWTDDPEVLELYELYYTEMLESGAFEGRTFEPMLIVDNDYVNWTSIYTLEELKENEIDPEDNDRILASKDGLYLVYEG